MKCNINKRFYDELIDKKEVQCHKEIYLYFYHEIWFCEKNFKNFLTAVDSSVKLHQAKQIYKYMQLFDDIVMPPFVMYNLIDDQNKLSSDTAYIPQDHFVHSVYLYILGIYMFFNHYSFHNNLIDCSEGKNIKEKTASFISKWKLFAFYHDVGYVFESNTSIDGNASKRLYDYTDLKKELLYQYVERGVARLITDIYYTNASKETFVLNDSLLSNISWKLNSDDISYTKLKSKLHEFKHHRLIPGIHNQESFQQFSCLLQKSTYLTEYINSFGVHIAYVIRNSSDEIEIYYNRDLQDIYHIYELPYNNYILDRKDVICNYYVIDLKKEIIDLSPSMYKQEILDFYDCLPQKLKLNISLIKADNDAKGILFFIYNWLSDNREKNGYGRSINETECYKQSLKQAAADSVLYVINTQLKDVDIESEKNLKAMINRCAKELKKIDTNKILENADIYYSENEGIPHPILYYMNNIFTETQKELQKYLDGSNYIKQNDDLIDIDFFYHNVDEDYADLVYNCIENKANLLGINMNKLLSYHLNHSKFDHGIVSASLVFQAIILNKQIVDYTADKQIIGLFSDNWNFIKNRDYSVAAKEYADAIFAILLHNVYTKKSNKTYGIDYKHDYVTNPFSYFCALTDVMQKWGRPKQLNFSAVDLPGDHYLEYDYDIEIEDTKIKIYCNSSRSGNMRAFVDSLEEYLPGASSIIKISEEE